jgi:hypothetical protein
MSRSGFALTVTLYAIYTLEESEYSVPKAMPPAKLVLACYKFKDKRTERRREIRVVPD